jgi:hypothetical protein
VTRQKKLSQAQYIDKLARDMKETGADGLQERVRRLVLELRPGIDPALLYYHTHTSKHSPAGFPDVTIVMPSHGRLIFAELKQQRARPTLAQLNWLDALSFLGGVEVYLWRPLDLLEGTIEATLKMGPQDLERNSEWVRGHGRIGDDYSLPKGA